MNAIHPNAASPPSHDDSAAEHDLITIALTSYNYADYVGEAITSVISQTSPNWRLVIFDNCSTDHTHKVVAAYQDDPRVTLIVRDSNIGQRNNLFEAFRSTRTGFVATLQADDFLDPTYVETALRCFTDYPESPFVFFNWRYYWQRKKRSAADTSSPYPVQRRGPTQVGPFLSMSNFVPIHMIAFRTRELLDALPYYEQAPLNQVGEQFLLKLLEDAHGPGCRSGTYGGSWRRHEKQLTSDFIAASMDIIEEPVERLWYVSHAPALNPVNRFMALAGAIRLSGHVDPFAAVDWLLGKGSRYTESFGLSASDDPARLRRIALTVALKFTVYSQIALLQPEQLWAQLSRLEHAASALGLCEMLEMVYEREGETLLSRDEIADIVSYYADISEAGPLSRLKSRWRAIKGRH